VLADAQTSGELQFGADPAAVEQGVVYLRAPGHDAALVGSLEEGAGKIRRR